jgi:hypothetical protein
MFTASVTFLRAMIEQTMTYALLQTATPASPTTTENTATTSTTATTFVVHPRPVAAGAPLTAIAQPTWRVAAQAGGSQLRPARRRSRAREA